MTGRWRVEPIIPAIYSDGSGIDTFGHLAPSLSRPPAVPLTKRGGPVTLADALLPGAPIECRNTVVGSFEALAICPEFLRAYMHLDVVRPSFPDCSELSALSDAQPHFILSWKRCAHQDFERAVILFRESGDVFDAHESSPTISGLRRVGANQIPPIAAVTTKHSGSCLS
jgi:hypothetical protein